MSSLYELEQTAIDMVHQPHREEANSVETALPDSPHKTRLHRHLRKLGLSTLTSLALFGTPAIARAASTETTISQQSINTWVAGSAQDKADIAQYSYQDESETVVLADSKIGQITGILKQSGISSPTTAQVLQEAAREINPTLAGKANIAFVDDQQTIEFSDIKSPNGPEVIKTNVTGDTNDWYGSPTDQVSPKALEQNGEWRVGLANQESVVSIFNQQTGSYEYIPGDQRQYFQSSEQRVRNSLALAGINPSDVEFLPDSAGDQALALVVNGPGALSQADRQNLEQLTPDQVGQIALNDRTRVIESGSGSANGYDQVLTIAGTVSANQAVKLADTTGEPW